MTERLTETFVKTLKPPAAGSRLIWEFNAVHNGRELFREVATLVRDEQTAHEPMKT